MSLKPPSIPSADLNAFQVVKELVQLWQLDEARKIAVTIQVEHLRAEALKLCNNSRPIS